ncbi:hypothetical protein EDWATA_01268 [Edwardsiella tarda ATCC 23685]|uniref:Uncharacterized protein n=1 Tax=Edwardsiella tarda ATCC 23685 TaxID=500638 RepID=D4F3F8_EDWTA|nr:hypothetical protein EDWATA_01268 [Edwardsiella tarda ATCC 23685]
MGKAPDGAFFIVTAITSLTSLTMIDAFPPLIVIPRLPYRRVSTP